MPTEAPRRSSVESLLGVSLTPTPEMAERIIKDLSVSRIAMNPKQPRTQFNDESLQELAQSIKSNGLLEPIIVRKAGKSAKLALDGQPADFELIAGERRIRAHKLLGLETIKAIVREVADKDMHLLALIENLQREDLSVLDRAIGVVQFAEEVGGVEEAATKLGMSRRNAFRYAKIGKAPQDVLAIVKENSLDLWSSELLISIEERLKGGENREYFLKTALKNGKDRASIEAISQQMNIPVHSPKSPPAKNPDASAKLAPKQNPYHVEGNTVYLSLAFQKGKTLSAQEKKSIVFSAQKFLRDAGAKKVDIRF